jgi:hypothetical protein
MTHGHGTITYAISVVTVWGISTGVIGALFQAGEPKTFWIKRTLAVCRTIVTVFIEFTDIISTDTTNSTVCSTILTILTILTAIGAAVITIATVGWTLVTVFSSATILVATGIC